VHGARDVLAFVRVHPGELVEVFEFAGNVYRQPIRIEAGNAAHAAFAGQQRAAELGIPQTVRTQTAKAGDHYATRHLDIVKDCLEIMTSNDKKMTKRLPVESKSVTAEDAEGPGDDPTCWQVF